VEDEGEGYDLDCVCAKEEVPEEVTDVCDLKENGRGILIGEKFVRQDKT